MTTIPKNNGPDYGLVFIPSAGTFKAHFTRSGKRLYRTLRTDDRETARERRDALYAALAAAGAVNPSRLMGLDPDDDKGIYRTKPTWAVRIHGHHVGTYPTRAQARTAKRKYLESQSL